MRTAGGRGRRGRSAPLPSYHPSQVAEADEAAPPPPSRSGKEGRQWDSLLHAARAAAPLAAAHIDGEGEAEASEAGGRGARARHGGAAAVGRHGVQPAEAVPETWGQATAEYAEGWSRVLRVPMAQTEAARARLHRRLKAAAHAARCATLQRSHVLRLALQLQLRLSAHEKGFHGMHGQHVVSQRRGLWLGVLRAPCLRIVAVGLGLGSAWLLLGEACATALLLPPPFDSLPALCPPRLATHLAMVHGGALGAAPLVTLLLLCAAPPRE